MPEVKDISPREAVCQYLGISWDSLGDYTYHPGSTATAMYTSGDEYICATANGKKPSKKDQEYITNGEGYFVEATGQSAEYCKSRGRTIWVFKI